MSEEDEGMTSPIPPAPSLSSSEIDGQNFERKVLEELDGIRQADFSSLRSELRRMEASLLAAISRKSTEFKAEEITASDNNNNNNNIHSTPKSTNHLSSLPNSATTTTFPSTSTRIFQNNNNNNNNNNMSPQQKSLLEQALEKSQQRNEELSDRLRQCELDLAASLAREGATKGGVQEMEMKVQQRESMVETLQSLNRGLQEENKNLKTSVKELKGSLDALREAQTESENAVSLLHMAKKTLEESFSASQISWQEEKAALEIENEGLKEEKALIEQTWRQMTQQRLAQAESERAALRNELLAALEANLQMDEERQKQQQLLQQQQQQQQQQSSQKNDENSEMVASTNAISSSSTSTTTTRQVLAVEEELKLMKLEGELESMKAQLLEKDFELAESKRENARLAKRLKTLQASCRKEIETQTATLTEQLVRVQHEKAEMLQKMLAKQFGGGNNNSSSGDGNEVEKAVEECRAQAASLDQTRLSEISLLKERLAISQARTDQLTAMLEDQRNEIEEAEQAVAKEVARSASALSTARHLEAMVDALRMDKARMADLLRNACSQGDLSREDLLLEEESSSSKGGFLSFGSIAQAVGLGGSNNTNNNNNSNSSSTGIERRSSVATDRRTSIAEQSEAFLNRFRSK